MPRNELIAALSGVESALRDVEAALGDAADAFGTGGGGAAGGGGAGGGGGGFGAGIQSPARGARGARGAARGAAGGAAAGGDIFGALGAARAHPVVAGIAAFGAVAGPPISQGLISASQGGDFGAGALSSLNRTVGKIPLIGELSGIAAGARVEQAVQGGIAKQIAEVEARGGSVSDDFRRALLQEGFEIERRRERSQQKSRVEIERLAEEGATGFNRINRQQALFGFFGFGGLLAGQALEAAGVEMHK